MDEHTKFVKAQDYNYYGGRRYPKLVTEAVFDAMKTFEIIYVARNAKDVAVSMYYHHKAIPMIREHQSWQEFYDAFINNDVIFGSWADHTLYWWNRRFEDNVMFVSYEQMKKDLAGIVSQVARFLDISLKENKIKVIADKCTFQSMKKDAPRKHLLDAFRVDKSQSPFVRKGKVGSWKSQFTVGQNKLFDEKYKEWIVDSDLTFTVKSKLIYKAENHVNKPSSLRVANQAQSCQHETSLLSGRIYYSLKSRR
ncbi:sulfotransferase 1 family member D1-like [Saccoglossus kowalevskii]|uniref:Sulfotransferase 1 family member D1-like n=1 Tax=Saccoglossus kowalevskii TaxID=10224 RepID=A0ABM0MJS8_SACKO|nr:PREDICTED: sulfotransferase 1 family member D1-like [Saccoglossus kowalevskii]